MRKGFYYLKILTAIHGFSFSPVFIYQSRHLGISPSAEGDQGRLPWTRQGPFQERPLDPKPF